MTHDMRFGGRGFRWERAMGMAVLAAGLASCATTGDKPAAGGAMDLFNGRDLAGWTYFLDAPGAKMQDVWSVKDGLLVCKGEPMGYLRTEKKYTSFALTLEWRWAPGGKPGNSGVLMRINGEDKPLPRSIEAQLKSGDAGDLYGFHAMKIDGAADRLKKVPGHKLGGDLTGVKKMQAAENAPGEWNRYEIRLEGSNLKVMINGKLVNEATGCEMTPGFVALQSEGGEIHFRNVKLSPL